MTGDKLSFLDEDDSATESVEPVQAEPVTAPPESDPGDSEPAAEPEGEKLAAPPAADPEPRHIPVTALLDEREKRQAAQREADEARRQLTELQARIQAAQQPQPDFYSDPDAALRLRDQQYEVRLRAERLATSRFLAEREFGKDVVDEAYAYFDQHPQESHALLNSPSPYHAAVEHYKRQKFLSEVKDPEAWKAQQLEALRQQLAAQVNASAPQKSPIPPASLANAPAAGGGQSRTPGSAFDSIFGT